MTMLYVFLACMLLLGAVGPYFIAKRFHRRGRVTEAKRLNLVLSVVLFLFCYAITLVAMYLLTSLAALLLWGR